MNDQLCATDQYGNYPMVGELARMDIVEFVAKFIAGHGYSPSFREIMVACDFNSTSTVAHHLSILRDLGKVDYQDNIARSVRIP